MRMATTFALFWKTGGFLLQLDSGARSREYCSCEFDERPKRIGRPVGLIHRGSKSIFGADKVEPHPSSLACSPTHLSNMALSRAAHRATTR